MSRRDTVIDTVIGVVLAGGRSRRFGRDKATLVVDGQSLVERAVRKLEQVCAEVVVADRGARLVEGLRSLEDGEGRGPAAGILGAAAAFPESALVVLACDLPEVPVDLLRHLTLPTPLEWLAPRFDQRIETLCARYGPAILQTLGRQVEKGDFALRALLAAGERVGFLDREDLAALGVTEQMFLNVNTAEDLDRLMHKR